MYHAGRLIFRVFILGFLAGILFHKKAQEQIWIWKREQRRRNA